METIQKILDVMTRRPVLFKGRGYIFLTYGLIIALTLFSGFFFGSILLQIFQIDERVILPWIVFGIALLLFGGKFFTALLNINNLIKNPRKTLGDSWFSYLGGFLGYCLACLFILLHYHVSISKFSDALLLFVPFFHAIGRIACINHGCCSCKVKESGKGLYFKYSEKHSRAISHYKLQGVKICPVHFYEMIANFMLGFFLLFLLFFITNHGLISACYFFGYGLIRFVLDPYRDEEKKIWKGHSLYNLLLTGIFWFFGLLYLYGFFNYPNPIQTGWNASYFVTSLGYLPALFAMSVLAFFVFGIQRK